MSLSVKHIRDRRAWVSFQKHFFKTVDDIKSVGDTSACSRSYSSTISLRSVGFPSSVRMIDSAIETFLLSFWSRSSTVSSCWSLSFMSGPLSMSVKISDWRWSSRSVIFSTAPPQTNTVCDSRQLKLEPPEKVPLAISFSCHWKNALQQKCLSLKCLQKKCLWQ